MTQIKLCSQENKLSETSYPKKAHKNHKHLDYSFTVGKQARPQRAAVFSKAPGLRQ